MSAYVSKSTSVSPSVVTLLVDADDFDRELVVLSGSNDLRFAFTAANVLTGAHLIVLPPIRLLLPAGEQLYVYHTTGAAVLIDFIVTKALVT